MRTKWYFPNGEYVIIVSKDMETAALIAQRAHLRTAGQMNTDWAGINWRR